MNYTEHRPSPALAPHLECLWLARDGERPRTPRPPERILPDGCVEWIFHLGDPFDRLTPAGVVEPQPRSFVVGELTRYLLVQPSGRVATMGVRFRPGGAYRFLPLPLDLLTDAAIPTSGIWGADGLRIEEAVLAARDDEERRSRVEAFLLRQSRRVPARPRLDAAVAAVVRSRGGARVRDVAALAGFSPRQLEREFRAGVGLSPKGLSRVIRFQGLLQLVGEGRLREWASLALEGGYADQPHLIREFRGFAGATPAGASSLPAGDLARHFVSPRRLAALLGPAASGDDVAFVQDGAPRSS
jgi:AraC-like DNA-binding protein